MILADTLKMLHLIVGIIRLERLTKKAKVKALEYYQKAVKMGETQQIVYERNLTKRIAILCCEIDKNYEQRLKEICKACKIRYGKPEPSLFYSLIISEIKAL